MKTEKKYLVGFAALFAVVAALISVTVAAEPSLQVECSFDGIWSTTYGQMTVDQSGTTASGQQTE